SHPDWTASPAIRFVRCGCQPVARCEKERPDRCSWSEEYRDLRRGQNRHKPARDPPEASQTPRQLLPPPREIFRFPDSEKAVVAVHSLHFRECFARRSEEHTSELQSLAYLVCRL